MNFTDDDVFPSKAENCCRKYGKLRLKTLNAAIFVTDEQRKLVKIRQMSTQRKSHSDTHLSIFFK